MMPRVAIVILNWNMSSMTYKAVEAVLESNYLSFDIFVVDNASADTDWRKLNELLTQKCLPIVIGEYDDVELPTDILGPKVVLIRNLENYGFAGGNNTAIALALNCNRTYEYVWILNNDAFVHADALRLLVDKAEENNVLEVLGTCLIEGDEEISRSGASVFDWRSGVSRPAKKGDPVHYIVGASMFIRKRFIERSGFMRECYFLYYEEIDWHIRAFVDRSIFSVDEAKVYHAKGQTIGSAGEHGPSNKSLFYLYRARLLFFLVNKRRVAPLVALHSIRDALVYVKRGRLSGSYFIIQGLISALFCDEVGQSWSIVSGKWRFTGRRRATAILK